MVKAGAILVAVLAVVGLVLAPTAHAAARDGVQLAASVDEMPPQMRRAYIVGIQEELTAHGYRPGPVDGVLGPRTQAAIRAYQHDAGLPVDGVASDELLDHMKFVTPRVERKTARAVPTGQTLLIQRELAARGYYMGVLDGLAGPETRDAAQRFRTDNGLPGGDKVDEALLEQLQGRSTTMEPDSSET
jgi:peptidoglycan hydrolase-like protein with peptidoglycan-binding domain